MKAIVIREPGGVDVLKYEDVPDPTPGDGEVLVRVKGVGVNYADVLVRTSSYFGNTLPVIPGAEMAGIVEAIGPGVEDLKPGDRVAGRAQRAYAELVTTPRKNIFRLPLELSFEQGAAIPVGFVTAWQALVKEAGLKAGERVLIHAAGSGVGSAAIQLAKYLGAWVVATAGSDWKLEKARQLGADATINYQTSDFADEVANLTDSKGVNVILEGVGGKTFAGSVKSLADYGRMVVFGAPSGGEGRLNIWDVISKQAKILGMSMARNPETPKTIAEVGENAIPLFVQGRFKAVIDRTLPLAQAAEAHRLIEGRQQFGKIVLLP